MGEGLLADPQRNAAHGPRSLETRHVLTGTAAAAAGADGELGGRPPVSASRHSNWL